MRHTVYKEIFDNLYKLNKEKELGVEKDLDELTKYVKSRDDKIAYLEKKYKKIQKSCEAEKQTGQAFIKEVEMINDLYHKTKESNENLQKEYADQALTISKLIKEQTYAKQKYEADDKRNQNELKNLKDLTNILKEANSELNKLYKKTLMQKDEAEKAFNIQKDLLNNINKEKNDLSLKNESIRKDNDINSRLVSTAENRIERVSKEISQLKTSLSEKANFIEDYLKSSNKIEFEIDFKNLTQNDFLTTKIEIKKLRKMITCSVCEKRNKDCIISTWLHVFWKECINERLDARERRCPFWDSKFSHSDVKKLYLE